LKINSGSATVERLIKKENQRKHITTVPTNKLIKNNPPEDLKELAETISTKQNN
jgi:hypothetical protein